MKSAYEQLAMDLPARLTPNSLDIAYAAGFFDGEGCITVAHPPSRGGFRAQVSANGTNLVPLEWLRERWGGKIYGLHKAGGTRHRQQSWQWHLLKVSAQLAFIEDVRPFLKVKGEVADNALGFLRLKAQMGRGKRLTETEAAALEHHVVIHRAFGEARMVRRGLKEA